MRELEHRFDRAQEEVQDLEGDVRSIKDTVGRLGEKMSKMDERINWILYCLVPLAGLKLAEELGPKIVGAFGG